VRLVFVADVIPPELRRIVEFLNGQMDPAEVLAVELRQYVGQGLTTLVPRIIGRTEKAQQKKAPTLRKAVQWDETTFFEKVGERWGAAHAAATQRIVSFLREAGFTVERSGSSYWSLNPVWCYEGADLRFLYIYFYGDSGRDVMVELNFYNLSKHPAFRHEHKRLELLHRLNRIAKPPFTSDRINSRPTLRLSALKDQDALDQFLDTIGWVVHEINIA
jgi:hypothetical protein